MSVNGNAKTTRSMRPGQASPAAEVRAAPLNRELSLLAFNRRVLAQAQDESIPLLERLKFLCIVSSNLDEFFEVRIASLMAREREGNDLARTPVVPQGFELVSPAAQALVREQYAVLNEEILPALAEQGIHLRRHVDRNDAQRMWVKDYFDREVRPLLTPIVLDPSHPFPQIVNKSLNFIVELGGKDAYGRGTSIAVIKAPRVLPRIIRLPSRSSEAAHEYCLLSSVIHAHIQDLFPGREVISYSQFRVTRDSDLWVDEEEVKNLRQALKGELQTRHFGFAVRLEVAENCPDNLSAFLLEQFTIAPEFLYCVNGPVNMVRLNELVELASAAEFRFTPFTPKLSVQPADGDLFSEIARQDILLHHPYQSFQPVINFIRSAAHDPSVVAIKQTIYRTGMNSELMEALITAAQNRKEVTVVVELMARFDEEANINWADRLEQVGAQVVYGVVGLKTHAKMALVIRRESGKLRFYAHMGTGNYHPTTTKFYTDFGLLTANAALGKEVNEVFISLTSLAKPRKLNHLWVAPFDLQRELVKAIRNEARIARESGMGQIIAKMNALVDDSIIEALYDASQAGVKIELIVRGACALRPGVPGMSENIRVRSIVGRFLEHSRIFNFLNEGANDVYLASADWMNRNLFRRIEIAFPVLDEELKKRVIQEGLQPYLRDNQNAWELNASGDYQRRKPRTGQQPFSAQQHLMNTLGA